MKRWNLKIELRSDFCAATGEGIPGITNIKTALEYGIPYIPAKRIKGCLLEAGREMSDNGVIKKSMLYHIYGKSGADWTDGIRVKNATLYSAPGHLLGLEDNESITIEEYEKFQSAVQGCSEVGEVFLEEIFTRRRTRTAIEGEYGTAQDHMLRTIQTVPAGIIFNAQIEGMLDAEEEKVLMQCAKGVRHMGIGITRGLGEVHCVLEKASSSECDGGKCELAKWKKEELFEGIIPEEEISLPYEVQLDAPVIVEGEAGEEGNYLSGSALLGALAGMYIRKYSLGSDAHKDEDFSRIFLRDGVQFGYGFLKKGEKTYIPCPKAVAVKKENPDLWFNIGGLGEEQRRKAIQGEIFLEDNQLYVASPKKEIHFHHARPVDRGIAHPLNDRAQDTSIPTGQFFQYIALSKGQTFTGTWQGKAKDLKKLINCLEDNNYHLRLGKSRTAEYGDCTIRLEKDSWKRVQEEESDSTQDWLLWLMTPMIPIDIENGSLSTMEETIAKQMKRVLGCSVKIQKIACDYTVFQGYNSKWRLPSISYPAIAAGSAFRLTIWQDGGVNANQIEGRRWGAMTGKGCGQVKVEPWENIMEGIVILDSDSEGTGTSQTGQLDLGGNMLEAILNYHKKMELARSSRCIPDGIKEEELPPSSSITMLLQILRSQKGNAGFYEVIKQQVEKIRKQNKRDRVKKLIEPCQEMTYDSMKLYLENAKWKARNR